jgi:hypothetical protein
MSVSRTPIVFLDHCVDESAIIFLTQHLESLGHKAICDGAQDIDNLDGLINQYQEALALNKKILSYIHLCLLRTCQQDDIQTFIQKEIFQPIEKPKKKQKKKHTKKHTEMNAEISMESVIRARDRDFYKILYKENHLAEDEFDAIKLSIYQYYRLRFYQRLRALGIAYYGIGSRSFNGSAASLDQADKIASAKVEECYRRHNGYILVLIEPCYMMVIYTLAQLLRKKPHVICLYSHRIPQTLNERSNYTILTEIDEKLAASGIGEPLDLHYHNADEEDAAGRVLLSLPFSCEVSIAQTHFIPAAAAAAASSSPAPTPTQRR